MYKVLLLISITLLNVSYAYEWNLVCKDSNSNIHIKIETVSNSTNDSMDYNHTLKAAKTSLQYSKDSESYFLSNNIYVIDEEQGNFKLYALGINDEKLETIAELYYEHEGSYLSGFIEKPIFESYQNQRWHSGFTNFLSFENLDCVYQ